MTETVTTVCFQKPCARLVEEKEREGSPEGRREPDREGGKEKRSV